MTYRFSCRLGALAGAAALLCALAGNPAHALGLGRITVQSALGEALRAEIDVPQITAEEAASLRVGIATADAFKAAGLDYTATVVGVQVSLQKRPDGRSFLRLSSSRPVTEPFVDLILEATWASGRVVRDYTLLFDPPNLRQAATPDTPTAPVLSRPSAPPTSSTGNFPASTPNLSSAPVQRPAVPAQNARLQPKPATAKAAPLAPVPATSGQKVSVKPGDTAGKIAAQNKPVSISLDQMLVALLRTNPDAFIAGNVNRLRSGAVLNIPAAEEAGAVSANEASSTIVAQAKDFNAFRQKFAASVPSAPVDSAKRQLEGKVQANVDNRATAAAPPDKLTLSKGSVAGKPAAEDRAAKDKQSKDASTRVAELSKNLDDLNKIAGVAPVAPGTQATSTGAAKPAVVPGVQIAAVPNVPTAPASTATAKATSTTSAVVNAPSVPSASAVVASTIPSTTASTTALSTGSTTTSAVPLTATAPALTATTAALPAAVPSATAVVLPAASAPVAVKKPIVVPAPMPEPSLVDELTQNPLVLPGLGLLLALLAGFGFYRYKKRNDQSSVDSSFLESRLQPDSFFGASGGQRIDTSDGGNATGSSLVYSPSQLDAAGDVDPVAEADVYLAYGRDLQAEEILKEAVRTNPSRVAIHAKLMEIYAKRRDLKSFESVATTAFALTAGNGPEWAYICELGRDLDPTNQMYQPGGLQPSARPDPKMAQDAAAGFVTVATIPQMLVSRTELSGSPVDFDLDLDFSSPPEPVPATAAHLAGVKTGFTRAPEPTVTMPAQDAPDFGVLDMDFGSDPAVASNLSPAQQSPDNGLSFDLDSLQSLGDGRVAPVPVAAPAAAPDIGMLEFDMGSLSLDLDPPTTESPVFAKTATYAAPETASSPLETKFALAEEFRALGDADGARSLAAEVMAQAEGSLKAKAQAFLNALT